MEASALVRGAMPGAATWTIPHEFIFNENHSQPPKSPNKEDLRARNRVAAKKWRDKKDEILCELENTNDRLRHEALKLRTEIYSLQTENHVLEEELKFFQTFMTKFMGVLMPLG